MAVAGALVDFEESGNISSQIRIKQNGRYQVKWRW